MSDKIYIDKEVLKECLAKAFDEGWTGYKDLKEDVVDKLLKVLSEKVEKEKTDPNQVVQVLNGNWDHVTWSTTGTVVNYPPTVLGTFGHADNVTLETTTDGIRGHNISVSNSRLECAESFGANGSEIGFISYNT